MASAAGVSTAGPSTAVVTGASSGIGLATVAALAAAGWNVIATARHPDTATSLRDLAAGTTSVSIRPLDVTDDASVASCIGAVLNDTGGVDLLVNNAGRGYRGTLEQLTVGELRDVMEVNFFGVARVTKAVVPSMRAARRGRIITVTSLNGVVAMPFSDAYNASKFAVEGLMEGLATVLREFGVFVSLLEPGPVRTPFFTNLGGHRAGTGPDDPYAQMLERYDARMMSLGAGGQPAESVAEVVCRIAADPAPALRYQSSEAARDMVSRKLADSTGSSVIEATATLLRA